MRRVGQQQRAGAGQRGAQGVVVGRVAGVVDGRDDLRPGGGRGGCRRRVQGERLRPRRRRRRPRAEGAALLAVATNVIGGTTTSSPGPTPAAAYACAGRPCRWRRPRSRPRRSSAARSASKASTCGPVVSQSLRRVATTAATSSSVTDCRPYGSIAVTSRYRACRAAASDAQPLVVAVRLVGEAVRDGLAVDRRPVAPGGNRRLDDEPVRRAQRPAAVVRGDHLLVQLLARPDADLVRWSASGATASTRSRIRMLGMRGTNSSPPCIWSNGPGRTAPPASRVIQNRVIRLSVIGRLCPRRRAGGRTGRPSRGCPSRCRTGRRRSGSGAGRRSGSPTTKSLSPTSLVAPYRLIGLDALSVESATTFRTPGFDGRVDHVLRAGDVGGDVLRRVVLGGVHLLEGGGVHHVVHPVHGPGEPVPVPDVADEPAQPGVAAELAHACHCFSSSRENTTTRRAGSVHRGHAEERLPERPRPAGDQHGRAGRARGEGAAARHKTSSSFSGVGGRSAR